jgi:mannosyltransferase
MSKELSLLGKGLRNNLNSRPIILLGLVLLLGAALRIYNLGTESYWVDEIFTVVEGQQSVKQILMSGRLDQPPAYYLPFHVWIQTFGTTEVSTRFFSALIGVSSLALIYLIGERLFGKDVGLIGAFLMAISNFQIAYSQEARFYAFFQFATLLSFLSLIIALKSGKAVHFLLYVMASVVMLFSHTFGIFILIAQNLFIVMHLKKYKHLMISWLVCQILISFIFGCYLYSILFGQSNIENSVASQVAVASTDFNLEFLDPLRTVYRFILPARLDRSWESVLVTYTLAGLFFVASTGIYVIRKGRKAWIATARDLASKYFKFPRISSEFVLLGCWLLCTIVLPFLFSITIMPIYRERYAICAAPALYLLLASGIFEIRKVVPFVVSLITLAIMVVPGAHYYYVENLNEQWRESAEYVRENSGKDEVIIFAPSTTFEIEQKTFNWYYHGVTTECIISSEFVDDTERQQALGRCISGYARFWVIIRDASEGGDPSLTFRSFFLGIDQDILRLVKEQHFVNISVYLFELKK